MRTRRRTYTVGGGTARVPVCPCVSGSVGRQAWRSATSRLNTPPRWTVLSPRAAPRDYAATRGYVHRSMTETARPDHSHTHTHTHTHESDPSNTGVRPLQHWSPTPSTLESDSFNTGVTSMKHTRSRHPISQQKGVLFLQCALLCITTCC